MRTLKAALVILALGASCLVVADGDVRPATAGERACMGKVLALFAKSCERGPQGWSRTEEGDATVPDAVPGLAPPGRPVELNYSTQWQDTKRLQAFDQQSMEIMQRQAEGNPMAAIEATQAKMQPLMEQMNAAAEKGDTAKIQALQKQMEKLSAEMQSGMAAQSKPFDDERKAKAPKDATFEVSFETNTTWISLEGKAAPEAPIGAAKVYRVDTEKFDGSRWKEGTTVALLGPWTLKGDHFEAPRGQGTVCSVLTLAVHVRGEKARARKYLESLDWAGLSALVK